MPLSENQHLLSSQIVDLLKKLGWREEDVISSITSGEFQGNDINTPDSLQAELTNLMGSGNPEGKLVLFKVGTNQSRDFEPGQSRNNHYVGLLFKEGKLIYIDPTGNPIYPTVLQTIQTSHPSLASIEVQNSPHSLQYTNPEQHGETYVMGGNDYDCGCLLALTADIVKKGLPQARLTEASSKDLGQILRGVVNNEATLEQVGQDIGAILEGRSTTKKTEQYNNTPIELATLQDLKERFSTPESQLEEINRLIAEFGNKSLHDSQRVGTGEFRTTTKKVRVAEKFESREEKKEIMKTISPAEQDVLDIMCLGQLLFESGNIAISFDMQDAISKIQRNHVTGMQKQKYPANLDYLKKCLTNFKPSIFQDLKHHFSQRYGIPEDQVQCLPKPTGAQVGAKIVIPDPVNHGHHKAFYVKAHQEFCSKSDPQLGTRTSNHLGFVDLKELFMYKVLEKMGYGPKVEFVVAKSSASPGIEEGIMIATQDSGYTKTPNAKDKTFRTFDQIREEIDPETSSKETREDLVAIDMISRVFSLGDVMINAGNFGRVDRSDKESGERMPDKWKILDLLVPKAEGDTEDRYNYTALNRKYGQDIAGSFIARNGNPAHTYDSESPVSRVLRARETEELWQEVLANLGGEKQGSSGQKPGIIEAISLAKQDVLLFLEQNQQALRLNEESGERKELTGRRLADLDAYCRCASQNFNDLAQGITEYQQQSRASGR